MIDPVSAPAAPARAAATSAASDGPELLHLDDGWTPQGQGYDAGRNELLTSYYKDGDGVLLSIQDKDSGLESRDVILGGIPLPLSPLQAPSHGGGVATNGEYVYLADTETVYVYRRSDIDATSSGNAVFPTTTFDMPDDAKASYLAVHDDRLYVGTYSSGDDGRTPNLYRYDLKSDGGVDNRSGPIETPNGVQGLAVTDHGLLFSSSQRLRYMPTIDTDATFAPQTPDIPLTFWTREDVHDIGNGQIDKYAQGINIIGGELWITYESGSKQYDGTDGAQSIERIPLRDLGAFPIDAAPVEPSGGPGRYAR